MLDKKKIKLGVIGLGAISERYLRILRKKDIDLVAAVDKNEFTAKEIKKKYGFKKYYLDYREIFDLVNAVIICLPNFLHASISIDFLKHGISVLCEKPMAVNETEAKKMVSTALETNSLLSIANLRRFYFSNREIKRILSTKSLGEWVSIEVEEGLIFSWPTKSGFFFDKKKSGGGVLIDMGSHLLDLILWWVDAFPTAITYIDDCFGGVEADAEIDLLFNDERHISVKLSRLRNLNNQYIINLTGGTIIAKASEFNKILLQDTHGKTRHIKASYNQTIEGYFENMIDDFLSSINNQTPLFVNPADVIPSISLIEHCYLVRKHFQFPWL